MRSTHNTPVFAAAAYADPQSGGRYTRDAAGNLVQTHGTEQPAGRVQQSREALAARTAEAASATSAPAAAPFPAQE